MNVSVHIRNAQHVNEMPASCNEMYLSFQTFIGISQKGIPPFTDARPLLLFPKNSLFSHVVGATMVNKNNALS